MARRRHAIVAVGLSLALVGATGVALGDAGDHATRAKKAKKVKKKPDQIVWAVITGGSPPAQPKILRGRGAVKVARFGSAGQYDSARGFVVRFNRKVGGCAYFASARNAGPGDVTVPLRAAVSGMPDRRQVYVTVEQRPGSPPYSQAARDSSFFVAAVC